jgi:hypothetical protein
VAYNLPLGECTIRHVLIVTRVIQWTLPTLCSTKCPLLYLHFITYRVILCFPTKVEMAGPQSNETCNPSLVETTKLCSKILIATPQCCGSRMSLLCSSYRYSLSNRPTSLPCLPVCAVLLYLCTLDNALYFPCLACLACLMCLKLL